MKKAVRRTNFKITKEHFGTIIFITALLYQTESDIKAI